VAEELLIYRNLPEESVLALTIRLDKRGKVSFKPDKTHGARAMEILGGGVGTGERFVVPEDGEAYLRAVEEMLQTSSMWSAAHPPSS
jgi:hypothetical protein